MKQFGIYIAILILGTACANQGELAQYDDDSIYATTNTQMRSGAADAEEAYYFVDESKDGSSTQRSYYGSDEAEEGQRTTGDDYVPEARSQPAESGRAYSNQRYNQPTTYSAYASNVPITMRLGYSSFYSPYYLSGPTFSFGIGFNSCMDPWWGYYDPWDPWCRWNRWNRWNSWYGWNMWSPWCPYGMGWGNGYAQGFYSGFHYGLNAYNWNYFNATGEVATHNQYFGPRPGFSGTSFNSSGISGLSPRESFERPTSTADSKNPLRGGGEDAVRMPEQSRKPDANRTPNPVEKPGATRTPDVNRTPNPVRTPDATRTPDTTRKPDVSRTPDYSRTPEPTRSPQDNNSRYNDDRRPVNPNVRPDRSPSNKRPTIQWDNGSRTPSYNRSNSPSNSRFSSPSKSTPSRSYTPSRSRSSGYSPSRSTPSRSSGSSVGGGSRGGSSRSGGRK